MFGDADVLLAKNYAYTFNTGRQLSTEEVISWSQIKVNWL